MADIKSFSKGALVKLKEHKDWSAWINTMPPAPNDFHVKGEVFVTNLGVEPILTPKYPQGINPRVFFLDLILFQKPGYWPQIPTMREVRYQKVVSGVPYNTVVVFFDDKPIVELPVDIIK